MEPHIHYCSFILEGTTQSNLQKLQVHQNCALRAVMKVDPYYSADVIREELGFDSVTVLMKKSCCKFAYKGFYDLGPPILNDMFELLILEHELRSNEELVAVVPRCKTKFGERNFRYRAVLDWNRLSTDIKKATSPDNFKVVLKTYHWPG